MLFSLSAPLLITLVSFRDTMIFCVKPTVGSRPPCRWIVNFDVDFMDGLVLAALVSAHAPFVVSDTETFVYLYAP